MKKKNIIKKLLSVILSAATMFSLLALPAYAVIPGEDAVTNTPNVVWHDLNTGIITPMNIEGDYVLSCNEPIDIDFADNVLPQQVISPDTRVAVTPTEDPYSGILLITQFIDRDGDSIVDEFASGTGCMLTERIMLTAMHCISPKLNEEDACTMQTRVYQGVSLDMEERLDDPVSEFTAPEFMEKLDDLTELGYLTPIQISVLGYDTNYFSSNNAKYDWCIAVLNSELDCYTFQLRNAIIGGMTAYLTGYPTIPEDHMYGMYKATGAILGVTVDGEVYHNIDATEGQSGAPIYAPAFGADSFPYYVYAIHTGHPSDFTTYNIACPITNIIEQAFDEADSRVE